MISWIVKGFSEVVNLHNGENDVGLISNTVEGDGGDHHYHEIEDPIGTTRNNKLGQKPT